MTVDAARASITGVRRFRIRYRGSDLEVHAAGPFYVGRADECHLVLDDGLVSRRHASFEVQPAGLVVTDMNSRNGIALNGTKVDGSARVKHLDRVTVGSTDLVVLEVDERPRVGHPETLVGKPTMELTRPRNEDEESTGAALVLAGLAEKALGLGRPEEAERILSPVFNEILARAKSGDAAVRNRLGEATGYALRIADGTRKAAWLDWVFEVHTLSSSLLTAPNVDRLHEIVRKLRYTNAAAVRRYVEQLRQRELGPSERFLVQRIEAILRVIGVE